MSDSNDFNAISRGVWTGLRDGTIFEQPIIDKGDYKEEFYGLISTEGINYPMIVKFIRDSEQEDALVFNWNDFAIPATHYQERNPDRFGPRTREVIKGNNIPFSYSISNDKVLTTAVSGYLNKRKDHLDDEWGIRLNINAKNNDIYASLWYFYENTKQFRDYNNNTPSATDYQIENKYVAISLTATNLTDFCYLIKAIEGETAFKNVQEKIGTAYAAKISSIKDAEQLDFLYENAPDFVFKYIIDELLFEDLKTLLKWDKEKWFTDTSNAMLNIIKGFKKPKELYTTLEKDPNFVLQLYDEMDKGNPRNFGEIISVLGILFCSKERDKRSIKIPLGTKYHLDSDLFFDEDAKTINIKVLEEISVPNAANSMDNYIAGLAPATSPSTITELKEIGNYPKLHPLDMVIIVNEDGTEQNVAAIYVKYLSDTAEKEMIKETIIIIVEVVSILISAGTLAAGAGVFWSTMAVADIALNTTDLALRVKEIKQGLSESGEAGKWFVDNWGAIYGTSGIILLGAVTVKGILTQGPKLLAKLTAQQSSLKNFINSTISSAVLQIEIANFTKNTFKYIPYEEIRTLKNIGSYGISGSIVNKMAKANVIVAVTEDAQTMALIYKGEAIAIGSGKSIKETLKDIFGWSRKNGNIATHLDELLEATVFVKKIANLLKTEADEAYFWSGTTDGIGGENVALDIAISKNGVTLERLNEYRKIGMPKWEDKPLFWEIASREYASKASGRIKAVIGEKLREGNIWEKFELPALKSNPNVKSISIIDPKTQIEKLIFKK